MAINQQDQYASRRNFHWSKKVGNEEDETLTQTQTSKIEKTQSKSESIEKQSKSITNPKSQNPKKKLSSLAISRFRSVLTTFNKNRLHPQSTLLGTRVIGTLFGHRRGHVRFAFQKEPNSPPAFLIELATPISGLVKEMASGLVRISLECDKVGEKTKTPTKSLLEEEGIWRTYCNGKKCGFANRRECSERELKILKSVAPISMGAGVLPKTGDGDDDGEIMYMRAKFERIVGSKDSEALYMMNPDSNGAPELSIYLLRV